MTIPTVTYTMGGMSFSDDTWVLDRVDGEQHTFLAHALSLAALHGPGPWPGGGTPLPDESSNQEGPRFAAGAMDGIQTHHFGISPDPAAVTAVADEITTLVTGDPDTAAAVRLHDRLAELTAIDIADDLSTELEFRLLPYPRVRTLARWLVEHGTRREAVKLGLVLLGLTGDERDRDLLLLMGTLEEFTLFALIALMRTQPDPPERIAYLLARRVSGWGRIHAVERLSNCDDPEIQTWLLREGFRNEVMNEYLAHLAATTGHLYEALLADQVDDALLDSAGDILTALADGDGGPAAGLSDYDEALPTLRRYADLVPDRPPTIQRLRTLLTIRNYLQQRETFPESWSAEKAAALRDRYADLVSDQRWRSLVTEHLADPSHATFDAVLWAAQELGIRPFPQVRARIEASPLDHYAWQCAWELAEPSEATALADHAQRVILAFSSDREPSDASRSAREQHGQTEPPNPMVLRELKALILRGLKRFPGVGVPLILNGLDDDQPSVRGAAVDAVMAWPVEAVPDEVIDAVRRIRRQESRPQITEAMDALLARCASAN